MVKKQDLLEEILEYYEIYIGNDFIGISKEKESLGTPHLETAIEVLIRSFGGALIDDWLVKPDSDGELILYKRVDLKDAKEATYFSENMDQPTVIYDGAIWKSIASSSPKHHPSMFDGKEAKKKASELDKEQRKKYYDKKRLDEIWNTPFGRNSDQYSSSFGSYTYYTGTSGWKL